MAYLQGNIDKNFLSKNNKESSTITNLENLRRARCVFHMFLFILNHNFTSWNEYCDILFPKMSLFYFLAVLNTQDIVLHISLLH